MQCLRFGNGFIILQEWKGNSRGFCTLMRAFLALEHQIYTALHAFGPGKKKKHESFNILALNRFSSVQPRASNLGRNGGKRGFTHALISVSFPHTVLC